MSVLFNLHPTIHQVRYSINIPKNTTLRKFIFDLEEILGKHTTKGKIIDWFNGEGIIEFENKYLKLSMPNTENRHWSVLSFIPNHIDTKSLIEVLTNNTGLGFSYVRDICDDLDYQNIPTIEAKFDLAIKGFKQEEHQQLADYFANIMIPIIPLRNYYHGKQGKNQERDRYINGNFTHYWFAHENNDILKGFYPRRAKRASFCKLYVKFSKEEKIWFLRFETTLKVYQIKGLLGLSKDYDFDLPNEFLPILKKIRKTKFLKYYKFAEVNYDRFISKLTNTSSFRLIADKFGLDDFFTIRKLEKENRFDKSAFKYNTMKIMSQRLFADKISCNLKDLCNKFNENDIVAQINQRFNIDFEARLYPLYNMF